MYQISVREAELEWIDLGMPGVQMKDRPCVRIVRNKLVQPITRNCWRLRQ